MTLEEKVSLVHGGSGFGMKAIPRLGIPEYRFSDGPNGVRDQEQIPTTYFPTGISMAATWNVDLDRQIGADIGAEGKALGKSVMLGPAVNIDLTPLGGRTFEYESEDPFLNARTCVSYIEGLQGEGILACVKHYAVNSFEQERTTVSAQIDERTLREIYLPAFEAAVKEAHVGSIMAAYNKLNGQYCAENSHLLDDILKGEWGFKGFAMSDWGAVHSTVPTAMNGLDLEMPGERNNFLADPLVQAVKDGKVPESRVDEMVMRILSNLQGHDLPDTAKAMLTPKLSSNARPSASTREHQLLARKVAEEAMVLLKNQNHELPLNPAKLHTLAVIGPNADAKFGGEGGSGSVVTPFEITPLQGIRNFLRAKVKVAYAPGGDTAASFGDVIPTSVLQTPDGRPGLAAEYFVGRRPRGTPAFTRVDPNVYFDWDDKPAREGFPRENFAVHWSGFLVPKESGTYDISTTSDDGSRVWIDDRMVVDNWGLHGIVRAKGFAKLEKGKKYKIDVRFFQGTGGADILLAWKKIPTGRRPWIDQAVSLASKSDAAILVVGCNHEQDSEGTDKPNIDLMDDQNDLVEAVLKANPRTVVVLVNGTPLAMPWINEAPAVLEAWYPGMEGGNALADILFGKANPSGKLPVTFPKKLEDSPAHALGDYPPKNGIFKYDEGLLVGYRWYDTKNIQPLFPFGHGLSYTTFKYSNLKVSASGQSADVTLNVTNTGKVAGAEVVQLYVAEPNAKVSRPSKELKAFAKVFLNPGETKPVTLHLNKRSFAYYSPEAKDWVVDGGRYDLLVGSSSKDVRLKGSVNLRAPSLKVVRL